MQSNSKNNYMKFLPLYGSIVLGMLILGWMLNPLPMSAQTIYGSISGVVYDQAHAVIPGAKVVVKNIETGITRETTSSDIGFYIVGSLPSGHYSVEASASSFGSVLRENISVTVAQATTVDFTLQPSKVTTTVTVTEEGVLIDTVKSQISKTANDQQILELPGRNTLNGLALLQPGAAPNQNGRPGSGFVVNGGRSRSNNFTIDGANNNDESLSTPRQNLPPEAIQEFQLVTNNFSAEYGRNSGSYVNVITRSGTNGLHGTFQWTWQGNGLNSLTTAQQRTFNSAKASGLSDYAALHRARGVYVDNLGGIAVGGPIKKDHTFFFTSYDREWYRASSAPTSVAISPQGLANLQAANSYFAPGALSFLTSTFPAANDPTSRGQINISTPGGTVAVPLTQFNRAINGALPYYNSFYRWLMKIDTRLSSRDNFSGRYLLVNSLDPGSPTGIPGNEVGQTLRDQSITLNEVHLFNTSTVNEFRFTYSRRNIQFPQNLPPYVSVGGFNSVGNINYPQFRVDNAYEFMDNLSKTHGRHTFKAGINIMRYQLNSFFAPNLLGALSYGSMADFLFDRNASFQQYAGDAFVPARTTELGTFFQDDFRFRPNLVLNLGVRYEYTGAPFGYFSNAKPDINNFAPRVGFAWTPHFESGPLGWLAGKDQLVIRGGYAISYDQVFQNILLNVARNYPRGVNIAITNISGQRLYVPANRPAPPSPSDYVRLGGNPDLLPLRLFSPNQRIAQPYGQQFSFGMERQFAHNFVFRSFYIGSRGVKLVREAETNIGFLAAAVTANPSFYAGILPSLTYFTDPVTGQKEYRMMPSKGSIVVGNPLAQSTYHSMQLTVEKRFSRGLQFQANYTWSSFINDSDDVLGGQTNSTLPANPLNFHQDRGRSGFDTPQRFVLNYVYQLPGFGIQNSVLSRIVGGWEISGVTTFSSGTPFSILNAYNALGILPGAVSTVEGSQRATINLSGTYPNPSTTGSTNAFYAANPANSGINGNSGRNIERTGGINNFDVALVKNTKTFGEHQSVQFRWELFNLFNHRNFTIIPSSTVSSATNTLTFLNLGQTNVSGRSMLFTLRYQF
ncbi:MAG: carboxypeptidase regulatory-like domain-containing protein [Acidobacteriia bacterium]|nr:carboxypeptidase regulatory-like domain-containing protein [Terriglobia bacterium]